MTDSAPRPSPATWVVSALCALAGFLVATRAIRAAVPWPDEYGLRAKLEHLEANRERYDVLAIGSSATYYGLRPRTFEGVLAERGHQLEVFNFGVGGMGSYEQQYVLRSVLERATFDYVLYEEPRFDPLLWYPDVFNPRYRHWHDWRTTIAAIRGLRLVDEPPSYKAEDYASRWHGSWRLGTALEHLALWARRATSYGEGPRIARAMIGPESELSPTRAQLDAEAGWLDLGHEPDEGALRQRERFLGDPAAWERTLNQIRAQNSGTADVAALFDRDEFQRLERTLAGGGAEHLWYSSPRNVGDALLATLSRTGELTPYLQYNDPDLAPELYEAAVRFDSNHLDAEGAERWSRRFATDFADWLDARAEAPR